MLPTDASLRARYPIRRARGLVGALLACVGLACQPPPAARAPEYAAPGPQLGPRPFYLLDHLAPGVLRDRLEACRAGPFRASRFSIGHRGAPLQFPEHTADAYRAAARMGAGMLECDVTFTRDRQLVCRHAQCDLATTTNLLETPLAARCRAPFTPARGTPGSPGFQPASARCCTADFTLAELRTLETRMDARDPTATRPEDFADATAAWRTDLYANGSPIVTHAESIALFRKLGVAMTPELKAPEVPMPFDGDFTTTAYARRLVDAYRAAGIPPEDVALQSFDRDVIREWLRYAPDYGGNAVWLMGKAPEPAQDLDAYFVALASEGFRTVAPPIPLLLELDETGHLRATELARAARGAGLELVTWTLERSGRIRAAQIEGRSGDFYLGPVQASLQNDGDVYRVLDALHRVVGVRAVFSDWPATTTFYASCMGID